MNHDPQLEALFGRIRALETLLWETVDATKAQPSHRWSEVADRIDHLLSEGSTLELGKSPSFTKSCKDSLSGFVAHVRKHDV